MNPTDIRELARDLNALRPDYVASQINAIADEFERLTAELDRPTALEAALKVELDTAAAELERLRAALKRIADDTIAWGEQVPDAYNRVRDSAQDAIDAARGE